jgi:hypothetical protein
VAAAGGSSHTVGLALASIDQDRATGGCASSDGTHAGIHDRPGFDPDAVLAELRAPAGVEMGIERFGQATA